ncbi:hypothetical protein [Profundibacter sp.]|uniref:hypothetical protein n=1 Tax=Profundibacter sp. TaxID=3101071 RepID=UPI003D13E03A
MDRINKILRLAILLFVAPMVASGQEDGIRLRTAPTLEESGLVQFLRPRFSLKTGVPVQVVMDGANVVLDDQASVDAKPVLARGDVVYYVSASEGNGAKRFAGWLLSDVGQRAIEQFRPENGQPFTGAAGLAEKVAEVAPEGNVARGETLSYRNCGRCHVIGARNRMKGIGSTPSFALMRSFPDWQQRFGGFYTLIPHPSFSQIVDVTDPFDPARPPPINPLELTIGELDDILAFVATIKPADLGAPLQTQ